jgi:hypothetical protein
MRKVWLVGMLAAGAATMWAQGDPPSRVARLNFLEGSVSFQAAGHDDWAPAALNYPMTIGDRLWADENSHAELHIGSTAIRLDVHTALAVLNLDDRMTQLRLSDGTIGIFIRRMAPDEAYEVDTPNGAVSLLRPGVYRIDADPDRQVTTVTVRAGDAEITAGSAFPVHARQSAFITGTDQPNTQIADAGAPDSFDQWCQGRDDREARRPAPRYVSPDMAGSEDLDQYGAWRNDPVYGAVWVPSDVPVGWAPYHYGHWAWIDPWGWTWVDDAPWGFAPFHYGRWVFVGGVWGWVPGPVYARPVYAPALVAWVGGPGFGVAWFPLGPREAFIPAYSVSAVYVNRVNMVEVTHINVVNVTNVAYVNRTVPGAVVAVSRADFAASRSVARVAVAVPPNALATATVTTRQFPVAREEAMAARPVSRVAVAHPSAAILNARVVTKTPPPAATASLARPTGVTAYRPPVQSNPSYRPSADQPHSHGAPPPSKPEKSKPAPRKEKEK